MAGRAGQDKAGGVRLGGAGIRSAGAPGACPQSRAAADVQRTGAAAGGGAGGQRTRLDRAGGHAYHLLCVALSCQLLAAGIGLAHGFRQLRCGGRAGGAGRGSIRRALAGSAAGRRRRPIAVKRRQQALRSAAAAHPGDCLLGGLRGLPHGLLGGARCGEQGATQRSGGSGSGPGHAQSRQCAAPAIRPTPSPLPAHLRWQQSLTHTEQPRWPPAWRPRPLRSGRQGGGDPERWSDRRGHRAGILRPQPRPPFCPAGSGAHSCRPSQ